MALALVLLIAVLLISRAVAMRVVYERAVKNNAVSQLETLKLDGEEQSVLIEGKSEDLPVLIMLHGGPQSPIIYGNGYRGDTPELTEHFLVVYWDCWGCGKNFADNTESVTLERQVAMTCDLVRDMKARFPGRKIFLFGYSNGTILATSAAETMGDDLAGIINLGPITSLRDAQEMAYQALKTEDMSEWDKKVLEESYERNDLEGFSKLEEMVTLKTSRYLTGGICFPTHGSWATLHAYFTARITAWQTSTTLIMRPSSGAPASQRFGSRSMRSMKRKPWKT